MFTSRTILTGLLVLGSIPVRANFSNYNSILIGDQAAGMGGAATAMVEDASGMAWYNPAGLAKLQGQSFSAAVGIYKKFDIRYKEDSDIARAGLTANEGFFQALPSSTGSVIRPLQIPILQQWTLGLSILVPEYQNFKGQIESEGQSISTLDLTTQSLWVGGAMARKISPTESMGFTIYYTARSVSKTVNDRTYTDSTHFQIFSEERNLKQNAIVGILGYHLDLGEFWKFGASYRFPSLSIAGKADVTRNNIVNGTSDAPIANFDVGTKARIPWKTSLGIAYVKPGWLRWAFDVNAYGPQSYGDVEDFALSEKIEQKLTFNFSTGLEYFWAPWLRTRVGVFSNYSSHPDPEPSLVQGQADHVDQAGFSANLGFRSENIEYTFGGYYTGGRGRSVQRIHQIYEVVTKTENVFTMLVGTSYSF